MPLGLGTAVMLAGIGIATGVIVGVTGSSGFIVLVPALVRVAHLGVRSAVGSSLAVDLLTAVPVMWGYGRHGYIAVRRTWGLMIAAVVGGQLGVATAHHIPGVDVARIFVAMTAAFGTYFLLRTRRTADPARQQAQPVSRSMVHTTLGTAAGGVVGVLTGVAGASGGLMFLMLLLYLFGLDFRTAVGTATAVMGVSAASGVVGYARAGNVQWISVAILAGSSMPFGYGLASWAQRLPERWHARLTGIIILLLGGTMVPRAL